MHRPSHCFGGASCRFIMEGTFTLVEIRAVRLMHPSSWRLGRERLDAQAGLVCPHRATMPQWASGGARSGRQDSRERRR